MKIQRRKFLKQTASLGILSTISLLSKAAYADYFNQIGLGGRDLNTVLRILNYGFGGHLEDNELNHIPPELRKLYSKMYNLLAEKRSSSYADLFSDAEIRALCRIQGINHIGGPMLGDVTPTGVKVWLRTLRPAEVKIRVETPQGKIDFGPVNSTAESEHAAIVPLKGLKPNTHYPYSVMIDGKKVSLPFETSFKTVNNKEADSKRIAFGTCPHRSGLGNSDLFKLISSRKPSAMLLGGDIAAQDRRNNGAMHRADYILRDLQPPWQRFSANIPVYATWDDHDYFDNDLAGIPKGFTDKDRRNVCSIFRNAWNNPDYGASSGVFFRTRIEPCDVIMLDHRYFRNQDDSNRFLGDDQMQWLKKQLIDCKGPFVILSCGTMWSDYVSNGKDSWGTTAPSEREKLFSFIEENKIPGVILISGDRHGARGFRIPRPSGYSFYEFEVAALGGRSGPPAKSEKWDTQLFGYAKKYMFGEFDFNTKKADPEVTFRLFQDNGKQLYAKTLKQSQLTPQ
ncbi:alkaline phosphatase D family protein [Sedimentisphaera salicampi]|uniref:alkaline phosphatase D family protein n=1 Tax=Sedimentisphaera salicampi TaxID=1941349 RepID=UPI000B9A6BAE|nr:alkaline phosphatase D family protein [Sedimentisphaera salicampi]OXU14746.1 PhoD-like phosphatase [Sedimentisphaera salicampi]